MLHRFKDKYNSRLSYFFDLNLYDALLRGNPEFFFFYLSLFNDRTLIPVHILE